MKSLKTILTNYDLFAIIILKFNVRGAKMEFYDSWIGISEAAEYLGVTKETIRNWIRKYSNIPAHRIGKLWKFKRSELDDWVKSGKSSIKNETAKGEQ